MPDGKPKRDQPWAVRGVSMEARSAATIAAQDAGMSLGKWLDRVVREAASDTIRRAPSRKAPDPTNEDAVRQLARDMLDMRTNIAQISDSLHHMAAAQQAGIPKLFPRSPRPPGAKK